MIIEIEDLKGKELTDLLALTVAMSSMFERNKDNFPKKIWTSKNRFIKFPIEIFPEYGGVIVYFITYDKEKLTFSYSDGANTFVFPKGIFDQLIMYP